jgi:primosomal replication protein N
LNRLRLAATIVGRSALRYTPAGLPVCEAQCRYSGAVIEAGLERQLAFEFAAVAAGSVAERLDRLALGSALELEGFLATTSHRSNRLRIHITEFTPVSGV